MSLSTFDAFKRVGKTSSAIELKGALLDRLHSVLFMMLKDIDAACRASGVSYTLGGGSCLGAVRHQNFIPWDDDLDINMRRIDFVKFKEALARMYPEKYSIYIPGETPGYDLGFPKVRLNGTTLRGRDDLDLDCCGVSVDVFYLDNAPDSRIARGLHCIGSLALGFAYSCRRFAVHSNQYLSLAQGNEHLARIFKKKILIGRLLGFLSVEQWTRIWDRWNGLCTNERSQNICIPVGRKHYSGEIYQRKAYFPTSTGRFGNLDVPLPAEPCSYLTHLYGPEFMQLPPEEDREVHVLYELDLGAYGINDDKRGGTPNE